MVQRRQRERTLFEVLLPDGHKLWPDWLRKIDTLLEDDSVIEVVAQALEKRWTQSRIQNAKTFAFRVISRARCADRGSTRRHDATQTQPASY